MANLTPEQALEQARAAAKTAAEAASHAQSVADQLAASVAHGTHAATAAVSAIDPFMFQFSVFVMAIFVGYYVVWSVTPALHTPLMSVTNAISSVIIVGALLAVGVDTAVGAGAWASRGFGFLAVVLAAVNIFGGFLVTNRMLAMYKKKS
jgi:NAD(P) transhydrogenase subunit alpha